MSLNQQVSPNEISANFLNSSVDQANAFQMMRAILLQKIQESKELTHKVAEQEKTIQSQQEELVKFKGKGVVKTD